MENFHLALLIIAGFLLLTTCNDAMQNQGVTEQYFEQAQEIDFETLQQGSNADTADQNLVIKTEQEFKTFWTSVYGNQDPLPELPEIDFETNMVVASIMETQSSGGYTVEILEAAISDDQLGIKVQNKVPGEDCITTAAMTTPYHIVLMDRTDKPVAFYEEEIEVDCAE